MYIHTEIKSSVGGSISSLKDWWDKLQKLGPDYVYFVNSLKSLLVVKEHCLAEAEAIFEGTGDPNFLCGGKVPGLGNW